MNQDTFEGRLGKAIQELENLKYNQTYNFTSLVSKNILTNLRGEPDGSDPFDIGTNQDGNTAVIRISYTPKSGKLMPLSISARFRASNNPDDEDVLVNPNYNTNDLYLTSNAFPPNPDTGVYVVEYFYYTSVPGLNAYIKFIATGFDEYTLNVFA